jgi:hypothetical protein
MQNPPRTSSNPGSGYTIHPFGFGSTDHPQAFGDGTTGLFLAGKTE